MSTYAVFVYGTLLPGEPAHGLLAGARRLGPGRTLPAWRLYALEDYPGMVAGGRTAVAGEVWAVDAAMLRRLDEYEGYPTYYRRETIPLASGREALAYILRPEWLRPSHPPIPGGDWRAWRRGG